MPSLSAIEAIESETGIPTLSASVATTLSILQALGLKAIAPGVGTLLKTNIKNTKE
jgi:maleate isomerase